MGLLSVLSPEGLEHVATHKYVPGKYTPLDNLLNGFWLGIAESLPMWLAPNLVTLLGFLPMVTSYALAWHYSPFFSEAPSRELALFTAFATWVYQTLDAVDGKQARRTGSSTPLGQLFDHGCDCMACLSHHSVASMALLPGGSVSMVAGLAALQTAFFFAQWQEYHTGVLRTSFGPVGVTETQFGLIFVALSVGIVGPDTMTAWVGAPAPVSWDATNGTLAIQGWVVFCATLSVISWTKTVSHAFKEKGFSGFCVAAWQLVPLLVINVALFFVWNPMVLREFPRKLCFLTGLLFFYVTAQMIVFSMARMPFPVLRQGLLLPYVVLAAASRSMTPEQVGPALTAVSVFVGLWVLVWLQSVLDELKGKLGIYAFRITAKPDTAKKSN